MHMQFHLMISRSAGAAAAELGAAGHELGQRGRRARQALRVAINAVLAEPGGGPLCASSSVASIDHTSSGVPRRPGPAARWGG